MGGWQPAARGMAVISGTNKGGTVPLCNDPKEDRLKIPDRDLREFLTDRILQAKEHDQRAIEHLEQALTAITGARKWDGSKSAT